MTRYPSKVKLVEVGPRDGLQNELELVALQDKCTFVDLLSNSGLSHIEVGSFVSKNKVPQMANTGELFKKITRKAHIVYSALVPNEHGLNLAIEAGATEISIFTAASETFNQKNINCSIAQSLERFKPVIENAEKNSLKIRAYISCAVACPHEGKVEPSAVASLARTLLEFGCYEVSLGDTTGVASPADIERLLSETIKHIPVKQLAVHFHDTYGQALANILIALQMGITVIDSSVAGLGGCPFAKGASGNVASEDLIYMLNGLGINSGVDLNKIISAGEFINNTLKRKTQSKVALATST